MVLHHPNGRLGNNLFNFIEMAESKHIAFHRANGYHFYNGVWNFIRGY